MKQKKQGYLSILSVLIVISLACIYLLYGTVNETQIEQMEEQQSIEQFKNDSISDKIKQKERIKIDVEKKINEKQKNIEDSLKNNY